MFVVDLALFEDPVVAFFEILVRFTAFELRLVFLRDDIFPDVVAVGVDESACQDLDFDAFGDFVEYFEVVVIFVSFVQRVDENDRFEFEDGDELGVVFGIEAHSAEGFLVLEVVENVACGVESLLLDNLYLVESAWPLNEFDESVENLHADRQIVFVEDVELLALDVAQ